MIVRTVSDLHFDHHADGGYTLTQELRQGTFDVLVVAGDLSESPKLYHSLTMLAAQLAPKPVVYVMGNHEPFYSSWKEARHIVQTAAKQCKNLHHLEDSAVTIQGQRFVGCTLWYQKPESGDFIDMRKISDWDQWISTKPVQSAAWLRANVKQGDIVVTHHIPHIKSVAPKYLHNISNTYYLHDMSDLVESGLAKLWVHGHTHDSVDYMAGKEYMSGTRVVCNPFGYTTFGLNQRYDESKDIDLDDL